MSGEDWTKLLQAIVLIALIVWISRHKEPS